MEIAQLSSEGMARQNTLANHPVRRLLWRLSLPAMVGMVTMALYNVIDAVFIGRGVGSLAIAGVTIAFPVIMLMTALGMMVGIGAASLVSRRPGVGDIERAELTLGNAAGLSFGFGLLIMIVGVLNSEALLTLFGASPSIVPYAREYMDIILLGAAFALYPMAINNVARAEGNARVAMQTMVLGALLNIVLDATFIFGLQMGVRGAALATVIAHVVTSAYVTRYFLSGRCTVRLRLRHLKLEAPVVREVLSVGLPSFVRMGAASIIILIINRTLAIYGGDISIAAFGIVNRSLLFLAMPLMAIGQGLQPILGFNCSCGRFDRVYDVTRYALVVSSLFSVVGFLVLMLLTQPIIGLFTTDEALIVEGVRAGRLVFLAFFLVGFQFVGSTVFQALGKVVKTLVSSTSRQILFYIPLVLVLPRFLETDGVWLAQPAADVLSFLVVLFMVVPQLRDFKRRSESQQSELCS